MSVDEAGDQDETLFSLQSFPPSDAKEGVELKGDELTIQREGSEVDKGNGSEPGVWEVGGRGESVVDVGERDGIESSSTLKKEEL